jgi:DUF4097 and DUF4098 domain-containing protein YvlB
MAGAADHCGAAETAWRRTAAVEEMAQHAGTAASDGSESVSATGQAGMETGSSAGGAASAATVFECFRTDAGYDAAATAASGRTTMKRSVGGPLILIAIGLLFLLNNLNPGFSIGAFLSQYWPFLLIVAGVVGLIEVLANASSGYDPARRHLRLGWIFWPLVIFGVFVWRGPAHVRFPNFGHGGVGIFGAEYEYDVNASAPAAGFSRVVLDSTLGSLNIKGEGDGDVKIAGRRTIHAFNKSDADRANEQSPVRIDRQGDLLIVRTEDSQGGSISSTVDLDITVPKRFDVEARGRAGDLSVDEIDGSVSIANGHGDIRLGNIGKDVRIEATRSSLIRAVDVKGNFDMDGRGSDVQLENIAGPATINGEYSGTLEFRNFAKSMHFRSSRTDFRVESIPGSIRMNLGDMKLENVGGPVHFQSASRDIVATDVTGELDLSVVRGDIQVTETKGPLPKMDIHSKNGNITLGIPEKASFDLEGRTSGGEVQNEYGAPLETATEHRSSSIRGVSNGTGGDTPRILLTTGRGTITVEKD